MLNIPLCVCTDLSPRTGRMGHKKIFLINNKWDERGEIQKILVRLPAAILQKQEQCVSLPACTFAHEEQMIHLIDCL